MLTNKQYTKFIHLTLEPEQSEKLTQLIRKIQKDGKETTSLSVNRKNPNSYLWIHSYKEIRGKSQNFSIYKDDIDNFLGSVGKKEIVECSPCKDDFLGEFHNLFDEERQDYLDQLMEKWSKDVEDELLDLDIEVDVDVLDKSGSEEELENPRFGDVDEYQEEENVVIEDKKKGSGAKRKREQKEKKYDTKSSERSKRINAFIETYVKELDDLSQMWRVNESGNLKQTPKRTRLSWLSVQEDDTEKPYRSKKKFMLCLVGNVDDIDLKVLETVNIANNQHKSQSRCEICEDCHSIFNCRCGMWFRGYDQLNYHNKSCPFHVIEKFNCSRDISNYGEILKLKISVTKSGNPEDAQKKQKTCILSSYKFEIQSSHEPSRFLDLTFNDKYEVDMNISDLLNPDQPQNSFKIKIYCRSVEHHLMSAVLLYQEDIPIEGLKWRQTKSSVHRMYNPKSATKVEDNLIEKLEIQLKECITKYVLYLYCCFVGMKLDKILSTFRISRDVIVSQYDVEGKNGIFWYCLLVDNVDFENLIDVFPDDCSNVKQQYEIFKTHQGIDRVLVKRRVKLLLMKFRYGLNNTISDLIESYFGE